jgi:hypothetical protein
MRRDGLLKRESLLLVGSRQIVAMVGQDFLLSEETGAHAGRGAKVFWFFFLSVRPERK